MKVLVFIGPSGAGKSTLINHLQANGIVEPTYSWTTRPRRKSELTGPTDHHFVAEEEFAELQRTDFFLEVIEMYGHRYGLPKVEAPDANRVPLISVRATLMPLVSKHFPDHVVYHFESDYQTAIERLRSRGGSGEEMQARVRGYEEEIVIGRQVCDRMFDTAGPLADVLNRVARGISHDFNVSVPKFQGARTESAKGADEGRRDRAPNVPARRADPVAPKTSKPWTTGRVIGWIVAAIAIASGLAAVGFFIFISVAMASFGSNK